MFQLTYKFKLKRFFNFFSTFSNLYLNQFKLYYYLLYKKRLKNYFNIISFSILIKYFLNFFFLKWNVELTNSIILPYFFLPKKKQFLVKKWGYARYYKLLLKHKTFKRRPQKWKKEKNSLKKKIHPPTRDIFSPTYSLTYYRKCYYTNNHFFVNTKFLLWNKFRFIDFKELNLNLNKIVLFFKFYIFFLKLKKYFKKKKIIKIFKNHIIVFKSFYYNYSQFLKKKMYFVKNKFLSNHFNCYAKRVRNNVFFTLTDQFGDVRYSVSLRHMRLKRKKKIKRKIKGAYFFLLPYFLFQLRRKFRSLKFITNFVFNSKVDDRTRIRTFFYFKQKRFLIKKFKILRNNAHNNFATSQKQRRR